MEDILQDLLTESDVNTDPQFSPMEAIHALMSERRRMLDLQNTADDIMFHICNQIAAAANNVPQLRENLAKLKAQAATEDAESEANILCNSISRLERCGISLFCGICKCHLNFPDDETIHTLIAQCESADNIVSAYHQALNNIVRQITCASCANKRVIQQTADKKYETDENKQIRVDHHTSPPLPSPRSSDNSPTMSDSSQSPNTTAPAHRSTAEILVDEAQKILRDMRAAVSRMVDARAEIDRKIKMYSDDLRQKETRFESIVHNLTVPPTQRRVYASADFILAGNSRQ